MASEQSTLKKQSSNGKITIKQWHKILLVCLVFFGFWFKGYLDTRSEPVRYAWPPHFQYDQRTYVNRGYYERALPNGYVLAGETTNIGESHGRNHLEGNVGGYVYMAPEDSEVAYFQHKEWDVSTNSTQPYWKYCHEENW